MELINENQAFQYDGIRLLASELRDTKGLVYIKYILCGEGANSNGDLFTQSELEAAYKTIIFKPIKDGHKLPAIGCVTDANLVKNDRLEIECIGVLWAKEYPEIVAQKVKDIQNGVAANSMECYFSSCKWQWGDEILDYQEGIEKGLALYQGQYYDNKYVGRILEGIDFAGSAIVTNPADTQARFQDIALDKAIASDLGNKSWGVDISERPWSEVDKIQLRNDLKENGTVQQINECYLYVEDIDKMTTWWGPHHEFVNGHLILNRRGLFAAVQALLGARLKPGTKILLDKEARIKAARHAIKHYRELQEAIPEALEKIAKGENLLIQIPHVTENIDELIGLLPYDETSGINIMLARDKQGHLVVYSYVFSPEKWQSQEEAQKYFDEHQGEMSMDLNELVETLKETLRSEIALLKESIITEVANLIASLQEEKQSLETELATIKACLDEQNILVQQKEKELEEIKASAESKQKEVESYKLILERFSQIADIIPANKKQEMINLLGEMSEKVFTSFKETLAIASANARTLTALEAGHIVPEGNNSYANDTSYETLALCLLGGKNSS